MVLGEAQYDQAGKFFTFRGIARFWLKNMWIDMKVHIKAQGSFRFTFRKEHPTGLSFLNPCNPPSLVDKVSTHLQNFRYQWINWVWPSPQQYLPTGWIIHPRYRVTGTCDGQIFIQIVYWTSKGSRYVICIDLYIYYVDIWNITYISTLDTGCLLAPLTLKLAPAYQCAVHNNFRLF